MSEKDEQAQEQENVEGAEDLTEETPEVAGHFFAEKPAKPAGPERPS